MPKQPCQLITYPFSPYKIKVVSSMFWHLQPIQNVHFCLFLQKAIFPASMREWSWWDWSSFSELFSFQNLPVATTECSGVLGFSLSGQYLFSNEPGDVWNPNSWNILLESLRKVVFLVSVSTGGILWKAQQSIWWTALLRWREDNRMFAPLITLDFPKMLIQIYFISSAS